MGFKKKTRNGSGSSPSFGKNHPNPDSTRPSYKLIQLQKNPFIHTHTHTHIHILINPRTNPLSFHNTHSVTHQLPTLAHSQFHRWPKLSLPSLKRSLKRSSATQLETHPSHHSQNQAQKIRSKKIVTNKPSHNQAIKHLTCYRSTMNHPSPITNPKSVWFGFFFFFLAKFVGFF